VALCAWFFATLARARELRLDRALARLESAPLEKLVASYAPVLRLAARVRPDAALTLFDRFDAQIPREQYPLAAAEDAPFLESLVAKGDRARILLALKLSDRLALADAWRSAARAMAIFYAKQQQNDELIVHLDRWRTRGTLDRETIEECLKLTGFAPIWLVFTASLPPELIPRPELAEKLDRRFHALCLMKLDRPFEALAASPDEELASLCAARIDAAVEGEQFDEAVDRARLVADLLRPTELEGARRSAEAQRELVLAAARKFHLESARSFEQSGDFYRAHRAFMKADLPGDARRVLGKLTGEDTSALEAEACERGGDFAGAAHAYERAGKLEAAADAYEKVGQLSAAARCLRRQLGEEAIESGRFLRLMERAGAIEELAGLLIGAVREKGRHSSAATALHRLLEAESGAVLPVGTAIEARKLLEDLHLEDKKTFDAGIARWVERARKTIEARYSTTWGLDLGTTKCSAAIFDKRDRRPVICRHKTKEQFASTLALDDQGNERVGLVAEELFLPNIVGAVISAKRNMGSNVNYKLGGKSYRPEEVAARLIRHARTIVEEQLRRELRAEVKSLAGEIREEWLDEAEGRFDFQFPRPKVVITIPAFFRNNQKHGTRDACQIAGVEVVRLIHEPTSACLATSLLEKLKGRCVVVDLGAGTLDISAVEIAQGIYEVERVHGDTQFGGNDFDAVITAHLERELEKRGVAVKKKGVMRKRLEVAAEQMKIELSAAGSARYTLRGFAGEGDVELELTREELAAQLKSSLDQLQETCAGFARELKEKPDVLLLVGGPMLSSLVVERIEAAFKMRARRALDPRTVVAAGAAVQGAILDRSIEDSLVLDVSPLALGIRTVDDQDVHHFSELIPKNHPIPVSRVGIYSTREDNQPSVDIEIFQGGLEPHAKIGQFNLGGILPAKKGIPQIAVKLEIDANCVLQVTAKDAGTGRTNTIRISDTTLISPEERQEMQRRLAAQGARSERQRELDELQTKLLDLVDTAESLDPERLFREWVERRDAYRPELSQPEEHDVSLFAEMFSRGASLEGELSSLNAPLRDLSAAARRFAEEQATSDENARALLDRGRDLKLRLEASVQRLRPLRRTLTEWISALTRAATRHPDPRRRFLAWHEAKDYRRALEAYAAIDPAPDAVEEVERRLDCLGHLGELELYRDFAETHASRLGAEVIDWAKLDRFCAAARPRIAWIKVAHGVDRWSGSGFLVGERLVATNQHVVVRELVQDRSVIPREAIGVHLDGRWREVESVILPSSFQVDIALLRLKEPVERRPFRLGYASLARLGQSVAALGFPLADHERSFDENIEVQSGVLNKFDILPGAGVRLFKVQIAINPGMSGGPLFNELGEVLGLVTLSRVHVLPSNSRDLPARVAEQSFAIAVDPLRELISG
jgi:molecular chaperone DnaK